MVKYKNTKQQLNILKILFKSYNIIHTEIKETVINKVKRKMCHHLGKKKRQNENFFLLIKNSN